MFPTYITSKQIQSCQSKRCIKNFSKAKQNSMQYKLRGAEGQINSNRFGGTWRGDISAKSRTSSIRKENENALHGVRLEGPSRARSEHSKASYSISQSLSCPIFIKPPDSMFKIFLKIIAFLPKPTTTVRIMYFRNSSSSFSWHTDFLGNFKWISPPTHYPKISCCPYSL